MLGNLPDQGASVLLRHPVARLDPGTSAGGALPVVFDRRVSASLIEHLVGALAAPAVARKASFLLGREDRDLLPAGLLLVDDPLRPRGLRSRPFDAEPRYGARTRR